MYVVQTDASYRPQSKCAGIGFVIKDKRDEIVVKCRKQMKIHNSSELEEVAVLEALKLIHKHNLKDVKILTDSNNIIEKLSKKKKSQRIEVIHGFLRKDIKIDKGSRQQVKSAHNLSRESSSGMEDLFESSIKKASAKNKKKTKSNTKEIKMVIEHRKRIMLRCPCCKESKSANMFPRYRKGNERRLCHECCKRVSKIHA